MLQLHPLKRLAASLLLVTVPLIGYTAAPAAAYGNAQMVNRTTKSVSGTIYYVGCRSDDYTVGPGKIADNAITETRMQVSARRGACLIKRITANVGGVIAHEYNSSGTGYEQFIITPTGTGYRVDSLASLQAAQADANGSPGFRIVNSTNYPVEVSLEQVSCLYHGVVGPGKTFDRTTGAVWFTIKSSQQMDMTEHKTLATCALPIAAIVGGIIISALTAGAAAAYFGGAAAAAAGAGAAGAGAAGGVAVTSSTVIISTAALKGAAVAAVTAGAKESLGAALKQTGSGEIKGQYAGPPWPFRCTEKPTYTISGGWGKGLTDADGNVHIPIGTALVIKKTNTCGNSMM